MKHAVIIVLAMLAPLAAFAQDESSCKAYFQVLRAEAGTPGLRVGMDSGQKRWWENKGRKKYPGLCLSGSVTSFDKPRYLVIWSNSKSIGSAHRWRPTKNLQPESECAARHGPHGMDLQAPMGHRFTHNL